MRIQGSWAARAREAGDNRDNGFCSSSRQAAVLGANEIRVRNTFWGVKMAGGFETPAEGGQVGMSAERTG